MIGRKPACTGTTPNLFLVAVCFAYSWAALAQGPATLIRDIDTSDFFGRTAAGGVVESLDLAFPPGARTLLNLSSGTLTFVSPGAPADDPNNSTLQISNPLNIGFDSKPHSARANGEFGLFYYDLSTNELVGVRAASQGLLDADSTARFAASQAAITDARGLAYDVAGGQVFVLDGAARIVRIVLATGEVSVIDLSGSDLGDVRGLALDPADGHLYVYNPTRQELYQLDQTGSLLTVRDLSSVDAFVPEAMAFAPTGDFSDNPERQSLYIAIDDGAGGKVTEWSLLPRASRRRIAAVDVTATLEQTIVASDFDPPSPDSAGIAYIQVTDTLLMSDSEVNEMSIFTGDNLFEIDIPFPSSLIATSTTVDPPINSDEPTGVAYNPNNDHVFTTDDDDAAIYEVAAGPDGQYGTSDDDLISTIDTMAFSPSSVDPEGIAYDSDQGVLFIVDGVSSEVYRIDPGPNGQFEGVAGDDIVTNFDTVNLGVNDPEGVTFDTDNNLLYVSSNAPLVIHVTGTGTLIRNVNISAANANKPAGLGYAPASDGSGQMNLYLTARGVDNNSDPNENDGRIYELFVPPLTGGGNQPPAAVDDNANTPVDTPVTIDVTANDTDPDGNLDPASANTACGSCSVPSNGTLANNGNGSFDYTPNGGFSGADSFVYEVCDAEPLCDTATVNISVGAAPMTLDVRVNASSDDAEENNGSGSVGLTSSDLELVDTGGGQTVGVRFNGLNVPQGSLITNAYVQFQADETGSGAVSLNIVGEAVDNATTFISTSGSISARSTTNASVSWSPGGWNTVGEAAAAQQTPNIAAVIQEIVNRGGWANGNSLAIIITGSGKRTAESFDGDASGAPLLHIDYTTGGGGNQPPQAVDDPVSTPQDTLVTINATANDTDPDGNLNPASANTACGSCSGPSNGNLVNNSDGSFDYTPNGGFNGADSFVYEVCDTEPLCDTATVNITVAGAGNNPPTAVDDNASTPQDTLVTINATANDTDPDGNLNPASANTACGTCSGPSNGSLTNNGNGSFDYTPNGGFSGADSFVYEVCDAEPLCDTATVNISVGAASMTVDVQVNASSDDAEENNGSGSVGLTSSDLELVDTGGGQTVGVRFNGLTIPQGALITNAYVQFQADETHSGATSLSIEGEAADNAATFSSASGNISSRSRTSASVGWSPAAWASVGDAGPEQQTPNIAAVIQEVVARGGWASGNSLVIIITGSGKRTAESFDALPSGAALLHVEYQ